MNVFVEERNKQLLPTIIGLREQGLSVYAIAGKVGVHYQTVIAVLKRVGRFTRIRRRGGMNLVGHTFGRLRVVARFNHERWWCVCSCGARRIVWQLSLRSGKTRSCGCLRKDNAGRKSGAKCRRQLPKIISLREQGLSIHAIGKTVGLSYQCVLNYLRAANSYKSFRNEPGRRRTG